MVEYIGDRDLVDIQTSKRTFIANGYLTHNCYAETFAERFRGVPGHPYEQGFDLRLVPEKLAEPLRWTTPKMVFVNSMSDLFHKDVPDDYIEAVVRVMRLANWHTYQVLTKRSERMRDLLRTELRVRRRRSRTSGGASASRTAATACPGSSTCATPRRRCGSCRSSRCSKTSARSTWTGIHWVIVGGESGPGARPMDPDGSARIRDQCRAAGVPFFFKQWGGVRKKQAGRDPDGRTYDEMPAAS